MTETNLFGPRRTTCQPRSSSESAWRGCGDHRGGRRVKSLRASSASLRPCGLPTVLQADSRVRFGGASIGPEDAIMPPS